MLLIKPTCICSLNELGAGRQAECHYIVCVCRERERERARARERERDYVREKDLLRERAREREIRVYCV